MKHKSKIVMSRRLSNQTKSATRRIVRRVAVAFLLWFLLLPLLVLCEAWIRGVNSGIAFESMRDFGKRFSAGMTRTALPDGFVTFNAPLLAGLLLLPVLVYAGYSCVRIVELLLRDGHHCPFCNYPRKDLSSPTCPECGKVFDPDEPLL
jgi:hypothetical protein